MPKQYALSLLAVRLSTALSPALSPELGTDGARNGICKCDKPVTRHADAVRRTGLHVACDAQIRIVGSGLAAGDAAQDSGRQRRAPAAGHRAHPGGRELPPRRV